MILRTFFVRYHRLRIVPVAPGLMLLPRINGLDTFRALAVDRDEIHTTLRNGRESHAVLEVDNELEAHINPVETGRRDDPARRCDARGGGDDCPGRQWEPYVLRLRQQQQRDDQSGLPI